MKLEEIKKLTILSRIDMTESEMNKIANDFDSILAYVGQVKEATKLIKNDINEEKIKESYLKFGNIVRIDVATEKPGIYSDKIIKEMPDNDGRYLKVKKIL